MMKRNDKHSLLESFKMVVDQYLRSTTAHGLKYLVEGRNICEVVAWSIVIFFCFGLTLYGIYSSVKGSYDNPILTSVQTTQIQKVPFPAVTVRGVEELNPWGFAIKSLDLIDLKCYGRSGLPNDIECNQYQKLREDFEFLFLEVIKKMDKNLTIISDEWDSNTMKSFPKKMDLRVHDMKYINEKAPQLASIYLNNTFDGTTLSKKLHSVLALHFGMYVSYKMNDFMKNIIDPVISEAWTKFGGKVMDSCSKEEEMCMPYLKQAYKDLYLPYFVMKFPIQKLGFGQFLSYFSRLVTRNPKGDFIISSKASSKEERIEKYLVKVFDNIVGRNDHSMNISVFEVIKVLHFSQRVYNERFAYANFLMKKFECGGDEQEKLNSRWLNWVDEDDKAVLAQKGFLEVSPPCSNMTEASTEEYYGCCKATHDLKDKLKPILKIMKYASQPPHYTESHLETNLTFEEENFLSYPLAPPLRSINSNPKIPICQYSGKPSEPMVTNCNLFSRSITNEGLGHTFNGPNFWALYSDTPYTKIFADIMFPKRGQDLKRNYIKDGLVEPYVDADVKFPETSGPSHGLSIVLDSIHLYSSSNENATFKTVKTPFKVGIHDPLTPADLRSEGVEVEAGYVSTILITPKQEIMHDRASELSEERRDCRFRKDNHDLKLFSQYSQAACQFECLLMIATNKCGCVPWDYPQLAKDGLISVCEGWGRYCFEDVLMDTSKRLNECGSCLPDCIVTRYSYSVSSTVLDINTICQKNQKDQDPFYAGWYEDFSDEARALPPSFIRRYQQVVYGVNIGKDQICRNNMKTGIAVVKFQLATQTVTQIEKKLRYSQADIISNLGGILSLLTGMSFLSLFEILFWLLRLPAPKSVKSEKRLQMHDNHEKIAPEVRKRSGSDPFIKSLSPKQQSFESSLKLKGSYNQYY